MNAEASRLHVVHELVPCGSCGIWHCKACGCTRNPVRIILR
jgi:hypothetical protein